MKSGFSYACDRMDVVTIKKWLKLNEDVQRIKAQYTVSIGGKLLHGHTDLGHYYGLISSQLC